MPRTIQPTFTGGEITPSLHSRVDLNRYHAALALCKNWFIHAQGGVSTRPGFEFVGEFINNTTRLIPFQFNTEQAYALVFGDQVMRVIRNGGYVLEPSQNITNITAANPAVVTITGHGYSNGETVYLAGTGVSALDNKYFTVANATANTFEVAEDGTGWSSGGTASRLFELTTPYTAANLFGIRFTQSADVMTLTHVSYGERELTRTDHHVWTLSTITHGTTATAPTGMQVNQIGKPSTSDERHYRYVVTTVDGNGNESQASSVFGTASLESSQSITAATQANPCVISCTSHGYSNGNTVYIDNVVGMTELNGRYFRVTGSTTNTFALEGVNSTGYTAYTSGGDVQRQIGEIKALSQTYGNQVSWLSVAGAAYYRIYKEQAINSGIFGYIGETDGDETLFTDYNLGPDISETPPEGNNPFNGAGNWPRCSTYYQQRQFFASTTNNLQTCWGSRSASFKNFDTSRPLRDDDSIQFSINAQEVNEIRHLVSLDALIAFTSGATWLVSADQDGVLTPSNVNPRKQGGYGSSDVRPLIIGETALYIQEKGGRVRDLGYTFQDDKYVGNDLSIMSEHLFTGYTIVDWCYAAEPYGTVWVVRSDGAMLTLTYLKEHQIWGWTQHDTDGEFESVCSISEGNEDAVYAVVKRTINGSDKRYIERLHTRQFSDVKDAFFVDSGLTYEGPSYTISGATQADPVVITATGHGLTNGDIVWITGVVGMTELNNLQFKVANTTANTFEITDLDGNNVDGSAYTAYASGGTAQYATKTITGLDHLEGETVAILADGNVVEDISVSGGSITMQTAASVVQVGLGYNCDLQTLNIDFRAGETIQSRKKAVVRLAMKVRDTRGLQAGITSAKLYETKERDVSMAYGSIPVKTGEQIFELGGGWTEGGQVFVRQSYPLPATVLAMIPEIDISG